MGTLSKAAGLRALITGDFKGAVGHLSAEVEKEPKDKESWIGLGRARLALDLLDEARQAFEKANALPGEDDEPASQLAALQFRAGDKAKGLAKLKELSAKPGASFYAHFNLGQAAMDSDDPDLARIGYERAVTAEPKSPFPHVNLGMLDMDAKNYQSALDHFIAAAEASPKQWWPCFWAGKAHEALGAIGLAFLAWEEALLYAPEGDPKKMCRREMIKAALLMGKADAAVSISEDLLNDDPEDGTSLHLLGMSLLAAGNVEDAKSVIEEAHNRLPNDKSVTHTYEQLQKALSS